MCLVGRLVCKQLSTHWQGDNPCSNAIHRCCEALLSARALSLQGVVHITGGGFPENIPRIVPKGKDLGFRIQKSAWSIPPLFKWLQEVCTLTHVVLYQTSTEMAHLLLAHERMGCLFTVSQKLACSQKQNDLPRVVCLSCACCCHVAIF